MVSMAPSLFLNTRASCSPFRRPPPCGLRNPRDAPPRIRNCSLARKRHVRCSSRCPNSTRRLGLRGCGRVPGRCLRASDVGEGLPRDRQRRYRWQPFLLGEWREPRPRQQGVDAARTVRRGGNPSYGFAAMAQWVRPGASQGLAARSHPLGGPCGSLGGASSQRGPGVCPKGLVPEAVREIQHGCTLEGEMMEARRFVMRGCP